MMVDWNSPEIKNKYDQKSIQFAMRLKSVLEKEKEIEGSIREETVIPALLVNILQSDYIETGHIIKSIDLLDKHWDCGEDILKIFETGLKEHNIF